MNKQEVVGSQSGGQHEYGRWLRIFPSRERLIHTRDLLFELVIRDVQTRYKNSLLGVAWSMVNPLMQLAVYYLVFSFLLPVETPHYVAYIFTGLLLFLWFQNALIQASTDITGNRVLVKRPGFATAALPIVTVTTNLIYFLLSLPILFFFLWWEGIPFTNTLLALPLLLAVQFVFTLGVCYLVAGLNVLFRDIQHLLNVLLRLLFFLTPIFYNIGRVPKPVVVLYYLNPLAVFVSAFRTVMMGGPALTWPYLLYVLVLSSLMLVLGYQVFTHLRYRFVEEL